jgi:hypothetical protein
MPLSRHACFLPLILAAALTAVSPPSFAKNNAESTWVLSQKHDWLGEQTVYLSRSGIRIENAKTGTVYVSHPPDWQVFAFNSHASSFAQTSMSQMHGALPFTEGLLFGKMVAEIPIVKAGSEKILGQDADLLTTKPQYEHQLAKEFADKKVGGSAFRSIRYWRAALAAVPSREGELLSRVYGFPIGTLVPLQLETTKVWGGKDLLLKTLSLRQSHPNVSYTCPPGLKQVKNIEGVALDGSAKDAMDLMFNQMDNKGQFDARKMWR